MISTNQTLRRLHYGVCFVVLLLQSTCTLAASDSADKTTEPPTFQALLYATLDPKSGTANVEIRISQPRSALLRLNLAAPADLFSNATADGSVTHKAGRLAWKVPATGGTLRYSAKLNTRRKGGFDARISGDWAVIRWEDLFPSMKNATRVGTSSTTRVFIETPKGWSVESAYGRQQNEPLSINNPGQRFSRPAGWLIAGNLGVRRDLISNRDITIAAPKGSNYPRVPTLAFLRWVLPSFTKVFPQLGERLLIVSGDETMWRGALSGPSSLYLHQDRPMISENSTSPLVHELVHVATRWHAAPGDDWIVEGIAEFYALAILHRSDGISDIRYARALESLRDWSASENGKLSDPSKGANTARAAILFADLHHELQTAHPDGLDAVIGKLRAVASQQNGADDGRFQISRALLLDCVNKVLGHPSKLLQSTLVD